MEYTLKIDTNTRKGKEIYKLAKEARKGVTIIEDEAFMGEEIPEGYLTHEQFCESLHQSIKEKYEEKGIIY